MRALGCTYGQGFFFARPIDAERDRGRDGGSRHADQMAAGWRAAAGRSGGPSGRCGANPRCRPEGSAGTSVSIGPLMSTKGLPSAGRLSRVVRRGRQTGRARRARPRQGHDDHQAAWLCDLGAHPARARRPLQGDRARERLLPAPVPDERSSRRRPSTSRASRPQVAVVTHGGGQKLEEPLAIRPTSEAIIWAHYSALDPELPRPAAPLQPVVQRRSLGDADAPVPAHQRVPLAGGSHGARHPDEARPRRSGCSRSTARSPRTSSRSRSSPGASPPAERFPGADETYTIEGLMRDAKALQCGTSHFLGQNFAKAYDVTFLNEDGEQEHAWGTSWGFSTRMVGGIDHDPRRRRGLRLPPRSRRSRW